MRKVSSQFARGCQLVASCLWLCDELSNTMWRVDRVTRWSRDELTGSHPSTVLVKAAVVCGSIEQYTPLIWLPMHKCCRKTATVLIRYRLFSFTRQWAWPGTGRSKMTAGQADNFRPMQWYRQTKLLLMTPKINAQVSKVYVHKEHNINPINVIKIDTHNLKFRLLILFTNYIFHNFHPRYYIHNLV